MTIPRLSAIECSQHRITYAETPASSAGAPTASAGPPTPSAGPPTPAPASAAAATPLVLLHGGATDHRLWGPQLAAFPERRVIAPDARGHGGSSDADSPYRLADDVVDLLDALEIPTAVLVGVSMGGGTAVDVALEHPSRVAGLVVSGTGTSEPEFRDPWSLETFATWKAAESGGDPAAWVAAFMRFTHGPRRGPGDVDREVWQLVETMAWDTLRGHLKLDAAGVPIPPTPPTPVRDTWARLSTIAVPVLALVGGADSEDHRSMGRRLASSVPTGEYDEIPGAAHYPNLEEAPAFTARMRHFLRRHGL